MSTLEGRVAFITGVARGQGRAHAVRLAREGVDIIGIDICKNIEAFNYPCASVADLEETQRLVEKEGRRMIARKADVRDLPALTSAFEEGYAEFGRVDIVIANAGMIRFGESIDPAREWQETLDVILTGTFNTVRASIERLREGGRGGSIVITSSTAGLKGVGTPEASAQAYAAAKRGQVGYMQVIANQYAPESIRVNTIHPTGVVTGMTTNEAMQRYLTLPGNQLEAMLNALPIEILQPEDIANAVAFLVSDEAHYITGTQWALDAGFTVR